MQRLSTSKLGCCQHKKHLRLENLRTLILADNRLDKIPLYHLADGDSSRLIKLFGFLSLKRLAFSSPSGKKALLIITSLFFSTLSSNDENEAPGLTTQKQKIMFPTLSMMDLSNNRLELDCTYCKVFPSFWSNFPNFRIHEVPANIHELTNLSVLNLSGNQKLTELPPQMGLLHKLWNLNTRGCNLQEPLATMMNSKAYKTSDVIGYLRSLWKFWWINQKIKVIWLFVFQVRFGKFEVVCPTQTHGCGNSRHRKNNSSWTAKTSKLLTLITKAFSALFAMKGSTFLYHIIISGSEKSYLYSNKFQEGGSFKRKPVEHWAKRMGNKNVNMKTGRGVSISTVGVDIGDW